MASHSMAKKVVKVVLCGPPHSGKSCLREGLKQALWPWYQAGQAPYPYVLTACPDGEGSWYAATAQRDSALAQQLKQPYKAEFTWEFAERKAKQIAQIDLPLTIIDLGGKIDDKNRLIMAAATHAVILAADLERVSEWKILCAELNLQIIALIHSDYDGTCDRITTESPVLIGSVHHLERGQPNCDRPMIQALATRLLSLCNP